MQGIEEYLSRTLGWPVWAVQTIAVMSCILAFISILQQVLVPYETSGKNSKVTGKFRWFQLQYLSVYLIIMLADSLQGTNMYTLYTSYGLSAGMLFLTGFLSSAILGTVLGIYIDTWGRKFGCLLFCILEIVINSLEHIPYMPPLIIGRILGGMSTSLLFSAFESWMVSEHRKRGFSDDLLTSTFAIASWGNGVMAICAGFVAQFAADAAGDIGPFQLAIALTVVCTALIYFWPENYGHRDTSSSSSSSSSSEGKEVGQSGSLLVSTLESARVILGSPSILLLGLGQACFESAVYTFVFVWVPSLLLVNTGALPTGLVFSSFMLSMTVGGMLFGIILPVFPGNAEALCAAVYAISAAAMMVPFLWFSFWPILTSFLVLECMVGMYYSCSAALRCKYYPDDKQSSIISVFRLPLNLLVVMGTLMADTAKDIPAHQNIFAAIAVILAVALGMQSCLLFVASSPNASDAQINRCSDSTTVTDKKNI